MSADERADFVAPEIHSLARELGNADIEVAQGGYDDPTSEYWAASSVPCALVPFITTLSFDGLHRALGRHPELYWHPIVRAQIRYLQTLQLDGRLWEKFRWGVVPYCYVDPPQQVQRVTELLQTLITAHADAIVLGRRVHWKRKSRPGPRVGFKNPHPEDLRLDSEIDPFTLLEREFPKLRAAAHAELDRAGLAIRLGGAISKSTRKALARVCFDALKQSEIDWSGYLRCFFVWPKDLPVARPRRSDRQLTRQWKLPHLPRVIDAIFDGPRRTLLKDGLPAALAYATLAALLDTTPAKIRNALESARRQLPKAKEPS